MNDTVERLLDCAEDAIRSRGYHAVSFRELADEVGIKSASVHYYFPRKDDLGTALIARYSARMLGELEARSKTAKTPAKRLDAFISVYRDALVSGGQVCLCVILGAESQGLPQSVSTAVQAFFEENIAWLAAALPEKLAPANRRARAASILATLQGAMIVGATLKDHSLFERIAGELRATYRTA